VYFLQLCDGVNFYHVKRNKVLFVVCSVSEVFPIMAIELLTRYNIKDMIIYYTECGRSRVQSLIEATSYQRR